MYARYDGLGRRVEKGTQQGQGNVAWTEYVYQQLTMDALAEFPQTGPPRVTYLYRGRGGALVAMEEQQGGGEGHEYWFAQDGLGSVAAVTKHSGQSAHEYFYDPYGSVIDNNGHPEDSSNWTDPHNHYLLTGKEWDEEMSLYYFGARYYDARTGTWLTQDVYRGEANQPLTLHRTLYALANPVNNVDAYGYRVEANGYGGSGGGSTPVRTGGSSMANMYARRYRDRGGSSSGSSSSSSNSARQDNAPYHVTSRRDRRHRADKYGRDDPVPPPAYAQGELTGGVIYSRRSQLWSGPAIDVLFREIEGYTGDGRALGGQNGDCSHCAGDPECEALCKLSPTIVEYAQRFNEPIFTNMTDDAFAAMLGAKLLYEGELEGGSLHEPISEFSWLPEIMQPSKLQLEHLAEWVDQFNLIDPIYRATRSHRDPLFQGASFGVSNVYYDQAKESAIWWQQLVVHQEEYGIELQEDRLETEYYTISELERKWYEEPYMSYGFGSCGYGMPMASPWSGRRALVDELRTVEGSIQFQALEMLHQGWKVYEGPEEEWGLNLGTSTEEISAFRIGMGVLANAPEPDYWSQEGSEGFGYSKSLVDLMPTAAEYLGLNVVSGEDYLPISTRDIERLTELGYALP